MMTHVVVKAFGGPEQLQISSVKENAPVSPGEVLVDVEAAGINYLDVYQRKGVSKATLPFRPGLEGVGRVLDAHLAGLRAEGVSYIFAGDNALDLRLTLEILNRELGVKRLLLEGGGGANGSFLRAGLVDELSLVLCPTVDGAQGAPSVFDSTQAESEQRAPITSMTLVDSQVREGGALWLRYRMTSAQNDPVPELPGNKAVPGSAHHKGQ